MYGNALVCVFILKMENKTDLVHLESNIHRHTHTVPVPGISFVVIERSIY